MVIQKNDIVFYIWYGTDTTKRGAISWDSQYIEKYITGAGNQKREPAFVCLAYQLLLERKIIDYVEKQDEKNCGYVSGIETASELEETETAEEELVTETEKLSMDSVSVEITYTFWYYTTYEQEQELTWAVNKAIKSMGLEMGITPLHFQ